MNKKDKKNLYYGIGIIALIAVLAVTGVIGSIGALVSGSVNFCDATPFDQKCICPEGQQKKLSPLIGNLSYTCEDELPTPATYSFPMQTWDEARAFAKEQFNGSIVCGGDYFYKEGYQTGPLPDLYTVPSDKEVLLRLDCSIATGTMSGQSVWLIDFDPFDGHVYQRFCNENMVQEGMTCPADIPFTPKP